MTPYEQGKELRQVMLRMLSSRKADLERLLKNGPTAKADYDLLVSVISFALAEVSMYEGENETGIRN